jgi:hypothetical protein
VKIYAHFLVFTIDFCLPGDLGFLAAQFSQPTPGSIPIWVVLRYKIFYVRPLYNQINTMHSLCFHEHKNSKLTHFSSIFKEANFMVLQFSQEAMKTIRAESIADVVSKVLSNASCNTFSLKNVGIGTSLLLNKKVQLASPDKWIN